MDRFLYIKVSMYCQEHLKLVFKCDRIAAANSAKMTLFILSKFVSAVGGGDIGVERRLGRGSDTQEGSWKPEYPVSPDRPGHGFP